MTKSKRNRKPKLTRAQIAKARRIVKEDRRVAAMSPYERGYEKVTTCINHATIHRNPPVYTIILQHKYNIILMCALSSITPYYFGVYRAIQDWLTSNPTAKKAPLRRVSRGVDSQAVRGIGWGANSRRKQKVGEESDG